MSGIRSAYKLSPCLPSSHSSLHKIQPIKKFMCKTFALYQKYFTSQLILFDRPKILLFPQRAKETSWPNIFFFNTVRHSSLKHTPKPVPTPTSTPLSPAAGEGDDEGDDACEL